MSVISIARVAPRARRWRRVRWWQALAVLALLGQFLAPLFVVIGVWPFGPIGRFIYWLGAAVCPVAWDTPAFLGQPMIVCPLCYGALMALTALTFSYPRPRRAWAAWFALPPYPRLALAGLLIAPWLCAYVFIHAGLWALPWPMMFVYGLLGGTGTALVGYQLLELSQPHDQRAGRLP
jgi:hypothetical protein